MCLVVLLNTSFLEHTHLRFISRAGQEQRQALLRGLRGSRPQLVMAEGKFVKTLGVLGSHLGLESFGFRIMKSMVIWVTSMLGLGFQG